MPFVHSFPVVVLEGICQSIFVHPIQLIQVHASGIWQEQPRDDEAQQSKGGGEVKGGALLHVTEQQVGHDGPDLACCCADALEGGAHTCREHLSCKTGQGKEEQQQQQDARMSALAASLVLLKSHRFFPTIYLVLCHASFNKQPVIAS